MNVDSLPSAGKPVAVADLVDGLKDLLSRFADRKYAVDPVRDGQTGVHVQYNTQHRNLIAFELTTFDKLSVRVTFDVSQTSPEYIHRMVEGIRNSLDQRRQERQSQSIIIHGKFR